MSLYMTGECGHSVVVGSDCQTCEWNSLIAERDRLKERVAKLREALTFYATAAASMELLKAAPDFRKPALKALAEDEKE